MSERPGHAGPHLVRPDQAAVLAYTGGYLAVSAVPGAGKTHVLAHLAADLIASGRPAPGQVLVVTYTTAAAGNFRARLAELLARRGLPGHEGYDVRTLHSLSLAILREAAGTAGLAEAAPVLPDPLRQRLLRRAVGIWRQAHPGLWTAPLRPDLDGPSRAGAAQRWEEDLTALAGTLISRFKASGAGPEEAARRAASLPADSPVRWAAGIYAVYERLLAEQGAYDFDDLVRLARRALEGDADLAARLRARWTYVLEDEAQDSTPAQMAILEALVGPGGNLVRVGDSNQAIMATFTAADPDGFRHFCDRPGVRHLHLYHSGRSSPHVIRAANRLVHWAVHEAPDRAARSALVYHEIRPVPPGDPHPNPAPVPRGLQVVESRTDQDELRRLARWAARGVREAPRETLAVLLPTRELVSRLAAAVREEGVPVVELTRPAGGAEDVLGRIVRLLAFWTSPHDPRALRAALAALRGRDAHLPGRGPSGAPEAAEAAGAPDPFDGLPLEEEFFPLRSPRPLERLARTLRDGGPGPGDGPPGPGESPPGPEDGPPAAALLERLRAHLARPPARTEDWILRAAEALGLEGPDRAAAHAVWATAARWLADRPLAGVGDVARWLREPGTRDALVRCAALLYERGGLAPGPGAVYVVTLHSAKGLEWDSVAVGAVTEYHFPLRPAAVTRGERWYLREEAADPEARALADWEALVRGTPPGEDLARALYVAERVRLLYVAVTRARRRLVLSYHTARAGPGGRLRPAGPSPALEPLRMLAAEIAAEGLPGEEAVS